MKTYQLFIRLTEKVVIQVGRLGSFNFPAGIYIYTGSARKNIEARIARHRSQYKNLRWHIDYLLANPHAGIIKVKRSNRGECELNQSTGGEIVIRGFGASDCQNGCQSHLKYLPEHNPRNG